MLCLPSQFCVRRELLEFERVHLSDGTRPGPPPPRSRLKPRCPRSGAFSLVGGPRCERETSETRLRWRGGRDELRLPSRSRNNSLRVRVSVLGLTTEIVMKKLALGIVAANAIVASTSFAALAQIGVHAGPGGFDVELGGPACGQPD